MSDPAHMINELSVLHVQGDDVNVLFGLYLDRAPWAAPVVCGGGVANGCLTMCQGRFKFPGFGGGNVSLLVKLAGTAFGVFPFAATRAQL